MFELGDQIAFYPGTRGRGGHVTAFCEVIKINRKTVILKEKPNSYAAGTEWRCNKEWLVDNLTSRGMCSAEYNTKF